MELEFFFRRGVGTEAGTDPKSCSATQPLWPPAIAAKEMYTNSECSGARITGESVNSNPALLSQATSNGLADGSNVAMDSRHKQVIVRSWDAFFL